MVNISGTWVKLMVLLRHLSLRYHVLLRCERRAHLLLHSFGVADVLIMILCSLQEVLGHLVLADRIASSFVLEYLAHEVLVHDGLERLRNRRVGWGIWFAKECVV